MVCRLETRFIPCPGLCCGTTRQGWDHLEVLLSLVYRMIRCLLGFLAVLVRSDLSKDVELLVLRHENQVLRREGARPATSGPCRPALVGGVVPVALSPPVGGGLTVTRPRSCAGTGIWSPGSGPAPAGTAAYRCFDQGVDHRERLGGAGGSRRFDGQACQIERWL